MLAFTLKDQMSIRTIQIIVICAISMFSCQLIKGIIRSIKLKKFDINSFFTTGGMPSSHTATVISLATALGLFQYHDLKGQFDYSFAVALVFAAVVIHDAMGVRLEASKHAQILNKMVADETVEVKKELGFGKKNVLKELLGHKPFEVFMGFLYGVIVAIIGVMIFL